MDGLWIASYFLIEIYDAYFTEDFAKGSKVEREDKGKGEKAEILIVHPSRAIRLILHLRDHYRRSPTLDMVLGYFEFH
jgi:hypothetical protein